MRRSSKPSAESSSPLSRCGRASDALDCRCLFARGGQPAHALRRHEPSWGRSALRRGDVCD
eukprot:scaffold27196_cov111-Isochrysis_galbana.AAC.4